METKTKQKATPTVLALIEDYFEQIEQAQIALRRLGDRYEVKISDLE